MSLTLKIFAVFVFLLVGGGLAFVLSWDIPAPSAKIETVLPDERFPE